MAGKTNLLVRSGRKVGAYVYGIAGLLSILFFFISVYWEVPVRALILYVPVMVVSGILIFAVIKGNWQQRETLEKLCGMNILVNLGTTASYILAFA